MKYTVIHETACSGCGVDLTQLDSVQVHYSVKDEEFDRFSYVNPDGRLVDVSGMIASGFHAGSYCSVCGEPLEELVEELVDDVVDQEDCNWYIRYEGTGNVDGPISRSDALQRAEQAEGMVFHAHIFEPEFVVSSEVKSLVDALQSCKDATLLIRNISQRAIDALILLSKKPEMSAEDASLVAELKSIQGAMLVARTGKDDAIGSLCRRVIDRITNFSREILITGNIEGGVLDLDELPPGVKVVIRDYDTQETNSDYVEENERGSFVPVRFGK
jgi:hypothetical protein